MFGESIIVINRELSIDSKNRISLPKVTKAEKGDKIYFMHDIHLSMLTLYDEKSFEKILEEYQKR